MLGPHTHTPAPTARGWRTPTARPVGGQSGEGKRLTSDAPHNGGRQSPGDALPPPPQRATPARKGARCGPLLRPHACTDRTRDTRVAEPRLPAPEDGRLGEGPRLTPDAPHNGGRHRPRGRPSPCPTASNASPQGRTLWGRCWVPTPAPTAPGTHGLRNPACPLQRTGSRGRDSAWHRTPLTTVAGHPPGDGPPPPPRHAAPTEHTPGTCPRGGAQPQAR